MQVSAIAFLLGCFATQYLHVLPPLWLAIILIPAGFCSFRWRRFFPVLIFLTGFFWSLFHASIILNKKLPAALEGRNVTITGVVSTLPRYRSNSVRFVLVSDEFESPQIQFSSPRKIRLSWYDSSKLIQVGERWRLTVRLKQPRGFQNPGTFDYEAWLFSQGINATGYVRTDSRNRKLADPGWQYSTGWYRSQLRDYINRTLADAELRGIIIALAVGDRSQITDQQWTLLRKSGTSHLIAISGLHVGLIATVLFFLGSYLWRLPGHTVLWLPAPKVGALFGLLGAVIYAALAGFSMPTQRALIMLSALLAGVLFQRRSHLSYRLAIGLLLVLVIDPLAVMAAGFWLSFAAVVIIGMLVFANGSSIKADKITLIGTIRRGVYQWTALQWAISIGLIPVLLIWFQQFSLAAPIANAIAIPAIGLLVVPVTLTSLLAYTLGLESLAAIGLDWAHWFLKTSWSVLDTLVSLDWLVWWQHQPPAWTLILAVIGVIWLLLPKGFPSRWIGIFWIAPLFLISPPYPKASEFWVTVLDVGQGLSVVVRTRSRVLVYDTGAKFGSSFDIGSDILAPYLKSTGVLKIDTLVVSHGDNDHFGGTAGLLKSVPVKRIFTSVPDRISQGEPCIAGHSWIFDRVHFQFLSPKDAAVSGNNASCVLHIESENGAVLLAGDIEAKMEQQLVAGTAAALSADVLLVPHHGSGTSSTPGFLSAVKPQLAVASYGYRNRYSHPHSRVLQNYHNAKIPFIGTANAGAITIRIGADGIQIDQYRNINKRFWMAQ